MMIDRDNIETELYTELHGGKGNIEYKDLFEYAHSFGCHIQIWTLEPGVTEGNHEHTDDKLDELYYVIEGRAILTSLSGERTLAPGEAAFISREESHGVRNDGPALLKLLVIYGKPISIEQ